MAPINRLKTTAKALPIFSSAIALGMLGMSRPAMAIEMYTVTDLGNISGADRAASYSPKDINNAGQVVGSASGINRYFPNRDNAFIWNNSTGMTDLNPFLDVGDKSVLAWRINESGQVVGTSFDTNRHGSAFLWSSSTGVTNLGTLGGLESYAYGINDVGQVVGGSEYAYDNSQVHAFLWSSDAGMTDLNISDDEAVGSYAIDINNNGQIAGDSFRYDEQGRGFTNAFLRNSDGSIVDLGILDGATSSETADINNAGQVVGDSFSFLDLDHPVRRAFLWNRDTGIVDLGTFDGDTYSGANGINDAGQVVGGSSGGPNGGAFLWSSDRGMVNLNTLIRPDSGWTLSVAVAINEKGQIVGSGYNSKTNSYRPFLLTPVQAVPTPALLPGLLMLGAKVVHDRRRRLHTSKEA